MSSSSVICGRHCNSLAARVEFLINRAASPGRLSRSFTGAERPGDALDRRNHFANRIAVAISQIERAVRGVQLVELCEMAKYARRVACGHTSRRNIFSNNAACTDHGTTADADAGKDD